MRNNKRRQSDSQPMPGQSAPYFPAPQLRLSDHEIEKRRKKIREKKMEEKNKSIKMYIECIAFFENCMAHEDAIQMEKSRQAIRALNRSIELCQMEPIILLDEIYRL